MYETLRNLLTHLGEKNLRISRAFALKLGAVYVRQTNKSANSPFSQIDFPKMLGQHPNMFDITTLGDEDLTNFLVNESAYFDDAAIISGKPFSVRVSLPSRLHRHKASLYEKPTEQFEVVSTGCLFAAYAPIEDYPLFTQIGHEYRDLLRAQIEKDTSFRSPPLGPSPIHPDFYFAFRKRIKKRRTEGTRIYTSGARRAPDVFLVLDESILDDRYLAFDFLIRVHVDLIDFYCLKLDHLMLRYRDERISEALSAIAACSKDLVATPWWRIFESNRHAHAGRTRLSDIYSEVVEFQSELSGYLRSRGEFLRAIDQDRFLHGLHSYLSDDTEPAVGIPSTLPHALNHFEQEMRAFQNIRSVLVASLAGAAAGALITAILTWKF